MQTEQAQVRKAVVTAEFAGYRLDKFLAETYPDLSRSLIQRLIENGSVTANGKPTKTSAKVNVGDTIRLELPPPRPIELVPEKIPLDVVYEDQDIAVIDKPAGLVVHPAPGHPTGTLVHALLGRYPELQIGVEIRPGIVHRLDKDTSGLIVIAKTDKAMASLTQQMKDRTILKEYLALVHGRMKEDHAVIDAPIGRHPTHRKLMSVVATGRPARTHIEVLETLDQYTLLKARLETGRTHQIRVHLASIGHPIAGDTVYGPHKIELPLSRQFLHACRLGFRSPTSGNWVEVESPLPKELEQALEYLRNLQRSKQSGQVR